MSIKENCTRGPWMDENRNPVEDLKSAIEHIESINFEFVHKCTTCKNKYMCIDIACVLEGYSRYVRD